MLLVALVVFRGPITQAIARPILQTWTTVFVSVLTQAMPFLVFGVVLSAVIAVFVPASFFAKALPKHPALAVPIASAAGVVLPGCECASVPVAGALVRRGITPAAALAFLLASPALNPVVLTATAFAFPNNPAMVVGRGVAALLTASIMGWLWHARGRTDWIRLPDHSHLDGLSKPAAFWTSVRHDVMHAGGFLVVGAAAAASLNVIVPAKWLNSVATTPVLAVLGAGRPGRAAVDLLRGRRVRGRLAHPVLADRAAGVPDRRADDRPQTLRDAGRHLRPPLRGALRPGHLRARDPGRHRRRAGAAMRAMQGAVGCLDLRPRLRGLIGRQPVKARCSATREAS